MNVETYYLLGMVISATLTILIYFVSKRQLKQATDEANLDGIILGIDLIQAMDDEVEQAIEEAETKRRHREQSLKSYYRRKELKAKQKEILENTTVVRAEELKRVNPIGI